MKTLQELFEMAVRGLASQGWQRSVSARSGKCVYRGPGGLKCAIAHCIPDNEYEPHFEQENMRSELIHRAISSSRQDTPALVEMQRRHDFSSKPDDMRVTFINFAEKNGLTWPADVPQEIAQ